MKLRPSRVLRKMRQGIPATCTKLNTSDYRTAELAAMCGFDCLWIDMEHIANNFSVIETQILAAKTFDVDTLVRVAKGSYSDLVRPLEGDAAGIMVPHLMSLKEAKQIAWQTKFHPVGRRPLDGGNADAAYCMIDLKEYMESANHERFVVVQIEDPEPLDELEDIAAVDGIDMLFFGPGDFSQGIGAPADWNHPKIAETRKRIGQICRKHQKFAGTVGSPANFGQLVDEGYLLICMGADVIGLSTYYKDILSKVSGFTNPETDSIYKGK